MRVAIGFVALFACISCGGQDKPAETGGTSPLASAGAAGGAEAWDCRGNLVPPNGWQQQTAFRDAQTPNARQTATDEAGAKLAERVCAGETGCDFLKSRVKTWKTGSNGKDVCAMAVISADDLEQWRRVATSLHDFDETLDAAAKSMLQGSPASFTVAIDRIQDIGYPGGVRAEWFKARMERHLQRYATVSMVPSGWAGDRPPAGIDGIVSGQVVERTENQIPILETTWAIVGRRGRKVQSDPVIVPSLAAPPFTSAPLAPPPPDSAGLAMRIDSQRGGSLCVGEKSQLWVKSDTTLYVRLLDLYGTNEGMVAFPNDEQRKALIQAGATVPMGGPQGFEAIPVPSSDLERFILLGAPTEDALGRFKSVLGPCRLPASLVQDLNRGGGLPPGVKIVTTGYRVVTGGSCPSVPASRREEMAKSLAEVPECRM